MNSKKCLICKRPNNTIHAHRDNDTGAIWFYCVGRCQRGYSLRDYCHTAGISVTEFLQLDFDFQEAQPNEVNKAEWPSHYIPMSDPRAIKGVEYVKSRHLGLQGDLYYDLEKEAIVFPMYYHNVFVGAQVRLLKPWVNTDGEVTKILTMPGTRLGLLFYNYSQNAFLTDIKGVIVTEGAFNCLAIQQSLDKLYGGVLKNPWKVVSTSGCGLTKHQMDKLIELKNAGIKIVSALDSDEAGLKGLSKLTKNKVITHYALTQDTEKDWNDLLASEGENFAKYFLSKVKPVL